MGCRQTNTTPNESHPTASPHCKPNGVETVSDFVVDSLRFGVAFLQTIVAIVVHCIEPAHCRRQHVLLNQRHSEIILRYGGPELRVRRHSVLTEGHARQIPLSEASRDNSNKDCRYKIAVDARHGGPALSTFNILSIESLQRRVINALFFVFIETCSMSQAHKQGYYNNETSTNQRGHRH